MVMKVELGLGVWDCSLASTATLLPPLWPNNRINLAFASHAQRQPLPFTCTATSPLHSTHSLAAPVPSRSVWRGGSLVVCSVLVWQGQGLSGLLLLQRFVSGEVSTHWQRARPAPAAAVQGSSPFLLHQLARTNLVMSSVALTGACLRGVIMQA